jgi:hypothetical protein
MAFFYSTEGKYNVKKNWSGGGHAQWKKKSLHGLARKNIRGPRPGSRYPASQNDRTIVTWSHPEFVYFLRRVRYWAKKSQKSAEEAFHIFTDEVRQG